MTSQEARALASQVLASIIPSDSHSRPFSDSSASTDNLLQGEAASTPFASSAAAHHGHAADSPPYVNGSLRRVGHLLFRCLERLGDSPLRSSESFVVFIVATTAATIAACKLNSFLVRLASSAIDSESSERALARIRRGGDSNNADGNGDEGRDEINKGGGNAHGGTNHHGLEQQVPIFHEHRIEQQAHHSDHNSSSNQSPTITPHQRLLAERFSGPSAVHYDPATRRVFLIEDSFVDYCAHRHHVILTRGLLHRKVARAVATVAVAAVAMLAAEAVYAVCWSLTSHDTTTAPPTTETQRSVNEGSTSSGDSGSEEAAKGVRIRKHNGGEPTSQIGGGPSWGSEPPRFQANKRQHIIGAHSDAEPSSAQRGRGRPSPATTTTAARSSTTPPTPAAAAAAATTTAGLIDLYALVQLIISPSTAVLTAVSVVAGLVAVGAVFERVPMLYVFIMRVLGIVGGGSDLQNNSATGGGGGVGGGGSVAPPGGVTAGDFAGGGVFGLPASEEYTPLR